MWIGSTPWPYRTAGILSARRIRRAAPLPNSVRNSAVSFTSGTNELLENMYLKRLIQVAGVPGRRCAEDQTQSITVSSDPRRGNRYTLAQPGKVVSPGSRPPQIRERRQIARA